MRLNKDFLSQNQRLWVAKQIIVVHGNSWRSRRVIIECFESHFIILNPKR
jgi:hypothetical protein